jgi:hypothetical protein
MVNEWLRFAEAKNGGLIALAGLALTGLLSFAGQVDTFFLGAAILMVVGTALWLGSIMLAIFSFKPRTSNVVPDARLRDLVEDTDNLFYFKHLAAYSSETLLTALGVDLESQGHRARFERNLADQVIANSRITVQKLDLFDSAIRWWVAGTLIVSAGVLWSFVGRT